MFDLKWIRDNPNEFDAGLARRGLAESARPVLDLDGKRRALQTEMQRLQERRNKLSKAIGAAKGQGGEAEAMKAEVAGIKEKLKGDEAEEQALTGRIEEILAGLPNLPAPDVPEGLDEAANLELRAVGGKPRFEFEPRQHFDLGEALGQMDFEVAARLSGARFVVLRGALARLERALAAFMLDLHTTEFGYTEISPPALVRDSALFGTGQLPKFVDDQYFATSTIKRTELLHDALKYVQDADKDQYLRDEIGLEALVDRTLERAPLKEDFWLIPTAEVPLTNLVAGEILDEASLPLRFTAFTPCFRAEAGAAGKDTRGMIRVHQFSKVELVSIVHPEGSDDELERMTACAEEVLKRLDLAYRVVMLCCGDMGFAARKTHDIEVWLPGQDTYREISSCSNCGDFQARRMKARYRPAGEKKGTRPVHTLNGSGLAVGRTLVAVLENHQNADGSVTVPDALRPYMNGLERIEAVG